RFYHVVLAMDEDGDGVPDAQAAYGLRYQEDPTGVTEVPPRAEPRVLRLSVVPNPARNLATVQFSLPARSEVQIALYDIVGRRVRTLLSGTRDAGQGTLLLECAGLPRGVYFLKLRTGGSVAAQ